MTIVIWLRGRSKRIRIFLKKFNVFMFTFDSRVLQQMRCS